MQLGDVHVTRQQIEAAMDELLSESEPEAELGNLEPDTSYHQQLEIDSVDFLRFMLALEKRLGLVIPELDYPRLSTSAGCAGYLSELAA